MVAHNTLTDPELHEPKGISSATSGSVYVANGTGSGAWGSSVVTRPVVSLNTLTSLDFTGLPSWCNKFNIIISNVTHNSNIILVQAGTSSGFVTTGYSAGAGTIDNATAASFTATNGMPVRIQSTSDIGSGIITFSRQADNTWVSNHVVTRGNTNGAVSYGAGAITLASPLTQLKLLLSAAGNFTGGFATLTME